MTSTSVLLFSQCPDIRYDKLTVTPASKCLSCVLLVFEVPNACFNDLTTAFDLITEFASVCSVVISVEVFRGRVLKWVCVCIMSSLLWALACLCVYLFVFNCLCVTVLMGEEGRRERGRNCVGHNLKVWGRLNYNFLTFSNSIFLTTYFIAWLVEPKSVKLGTSCIVILPPIVSVLLQFQGV